MKNEENKIDLKKFITEWNIQYPYDRYWRLKYNIPFGSAAHREMNFIDMALDLMEEKVIKQLEREDAKITDMDRDFFNAELPEDCKISGNQEPEVVKKMTKDELDKDFAELDISQFND